MMRPAGATAGRNCSLCEAGTYQTGSGQDAVMGGHLRIISLFLSAFLLESAFNLISQVEQAEVLMADVTIVHIRVARHSIDDAARRRHCQQQLQPV